MCIQKGWSFWWLSWLSFIGTKPIFEFGRELSESNPCMSSVIMDDTVSISANRHGAVILVVILVIVYWTKQIFKLGREYDFHIVDHFGDHLGDCLSDKPIFELDLRALFFVSSQYVIHCPHASSTYFQLIFSFYNRRI